MTVVLGGTTQLSCTPTVDGNRTTVVWFISPRNGSSIIISMNQTVLGTSVFVGSEYNSPLILTNVASELNGASVGCRYSNGESIVVQVVQTRPTITVLCELRLFVVTT